MAASFSDEYLGQRLFHFWGHSPAHSAFAVFKSIVERGLLLSRATQELIDRFHYRRRDGRIEHFEIVQNARVCLTDIPEDKVSLPCDRYGRCAVGFARSQILEWAGLPVWYIPNHHVSGAMTDQGAALLSWVYTTAEVASFVLPRFVRMTGRTITSGEMAIHEGNVDWWASSMLEATRRFGCFVKEMSSKDVDDHRYLYEREWRIVSGLVSEEFGDPCRRPSDSEKQELLDMRPEWGDPMKSLDPRITAQFTEERLIDSFWFFNGIPGERTVSEAIEVILVPDERLRQSVESYIAANAEKFRAGGPEVRIAPST